MIMTKLRLHNNFMLKFAYLLCTYLVAQARN